MQKIINTILNLSPKKMALYLILSPSLLLLAYVINLIFAASSTANESIANIILSVLFVFLIIIVLLSLFWLHSTVNSVEKTDLGLPLRWFYIALASLVVYLLYGLSYSLVEGVSEADQHMFHGLGEFIAIGGLLIAYPILCHCAARAILVKRANQPATFIRAVPFTLLLFFGAVLAIPFLQRYFCTERSTDSELITIYATAFGLFFLVLVIGFLASVTGLV